VFIGHKIKFGFGISFRAGFGPEMPARLQLWIVYDFIKTKLAIVVEGLIFGAINKKDVRIQGRFIQCGHFANKRGSSYADVRTFWCKKHLIFRNLWCVNTDKEGWGI